jgi:predicted aldo/keto reductase-like oxidoreductase
MKYRRFGKLNWKVSALGFGAMRLPVIGGDRSNIDEAEATKLVRHAIDNGVNYIDSGYMYHGGNSESFLGRVLQDGYREKVKVATKMPMMQVTSRDDMERIFNEQLRKLQRDYMEFYLFHGLNRDRWKQAKDLDVLKWADQKKAEGKIRHLGFSFHDTFDVFKEIVDAYDWNLCQVQYNYIDSKSSSRTPGTEGLKYATSKGLAIVVMEPIQGGNLAMKQRPEVQSLWDSCEVKRTPAEWALQYVWNQPEVSVVLSGMSTYQQVVENLQSAERSGPRTLSKKELEIIRNVRKQYLDYGLIGCTACRYCQPCPQGVAIPEIIQLYNEYYRRWGDKAAQSQVIKKRKEMVPQEKWASACAKCGECEEKCPQQLPIRNVLEKAVRAFEEN